MLFIKVAIPEEQSKNNPLQNEKKNLFDLCDDKSKKKRNFITKYSKQRNYRISLIMEIEIATKYKL
jgi:hypothetical protein